MLTHFIDFFVISLWELIYCKKIKYLKIVLEKKKKNCNKYIGTD